jgi:predicted acyltransferase
MLLGLIAGRILTSQRAPQSKQFALWLSAALCVLIALAVDGMGVCPIVKRIWTPTWALWSGGLCFAWLAVLNCVCDWGGFKSWGWLFVVIGANSIVAYVMSWVLEEPIQKAIAPFLGSFRHLIGDWLPFVSGVLTLFVMWMILWTLYRKRIFVKI